jgi:hypothetical protein
LEQLEWIVAYLYKIRKPELVRAVDRNRKHILERISWWTPPRTPPGVSSDWKSRLARRSGRRWLQEVDKAAEG